MRFACQMANQHKMRVNVIECDSKTLTNSLNSQALGPAYCDVIVEDIRELAQKLGCTSFAFVKREGNKVAHFAARGPNFINIHHIPSHLYELLEIDVRQHSLD